MKIYQMVMQHILQTIVNNIKHQIMKPIKLTLILIAIFTTVCCKSQQLIKTEKDAHKIKENEKQFINKPLKDLLKEIKPQIKRVFGNPIKNSYETVGYFMFNFVDLQQYDSLKVNKKTPVTIVVYVKEYFDWDFHKRPKGKETVWTKDDAHKYENLTVVGFRVYGDTTIAN